MSRRVTSWTAALLALAIAGLPMLLERCVAACAAHGPAAASCHHEANGNAPRAASATASCSHEPAIAAASTGLPAAGDRSADLSVAVSPVAIAPVPIVTRTFDDTSPPPLECAPTHARPLRI